MRERGWLCESLLLRHNYHVRITAEIRKRTDFPANPGLVHTWTRGVRGARYLVADNTRNLGRVRIQALTREDIGKVDAAGFYTDANLALARNRIGGFTQLQLLRAAMPNDEYLFHFFSPPNAGKNQPGSIQNLAAEIHLLCGQKRSHSRDCG